MRLYPPVTEEEALAWLKEQAVAAWGDARAAELAENLQTMAEAMAIVSSFELPDELEPLFP